MEKITDKELAEIEAALYKVAEILIRCEASEDKYDQIFIRNMEFRINQLLGENHAYGLGYKQEV